jgi:hypothetical protein
MFFRKFWPKIFHKIDSRSQYHDDSCVEELVPMIRSGSRGSDNDDDDNDGEWSKIDVRDFGGKGFGAKVCTLVRLRFLDSDTFLKILLKRTA